MIPGDAVIRLARATDRLEAIAQMYQQGLGFVRLAEFVGHEGFDGIILGHKQHPWHLEFTHHHGSRAGGSPSEDNLLVFYLPDSGQWQSACERLWSCWGFR